MQCPNCGQEGEGKFCTRCGARMQEATAPPVQVTTGISQEAMADLTLASSSSTVVLAPGSTAVMAPPAAYGPSSFPIQVAFDTPPSSNRFFAVPLIGFLVKAVMLIPHIICLYALSLVVGVLQLVTWIPVLTSGRYPAWGYSLVSGTIRWAIRVYAYLYGLTDQYPPFTLSEVAAYPVRVSIPLPDSSKRLWAVPVLGFVIKVVLLIPHLVVLYALGAVAGILMLVTWVPVLFTGTYPDYGRSLIGGYLRWYARVAGYLLGLTDQYPPFQLGG